MKGNLLSTSWKFLLFLFLSIFTSGFITENTYAGAVIVVNCGDGTLQGTEACDNGGLCTGDNSTYCQSDTDCSSVGGPCTPRDGDGCTSTFCTVEEGWTCIGGGQFSCTPICGDKLIKGNEQCDNGGLCTGDNTTPCLSDNDCSSVGGTCTPRDGDGCSSTCTCETSPNIFEGGDFIFVPGCGPICGDGLCDTPETCDSCPTDCGTCPTICGNGAVETGEDCDDGNTTDGDGCSVTCAVEEGWTCTGEPSSCTPICGDGLIKGNEQCDDGNTANGDGCSDICTCETGFGDFKSAGRWVVPGCEPAAICGNEVLETGEDCDDGNTADGDCCSATCQFDAQGSSCNNGQGVCDGQGYCKPNNLNGRGCGNGILEGPSKSISEDFSSRILENPEQCDPPDGECCDAKCQFAPENTPCHDGAGYCDSTGVCHDNPRIGFKGTEGWTDDGGDNGGLDGITVSAIIQEGDQENSTARFRVVLNGPSNREVTVNFCTQDNTAQAGVDYEALCGTLTFPPGATEEEIVITIMGDLLTESDETFFILLSDPQNGSLEMDQGVGVILDDDLDTVVKLFNAEGSGGCNLSVLSRPRDLFFILLPLLPLGLFFLIKRGIAFACIHPENRRKGKK